MSEPIRAHEASGRYFTAAGVRSFVLDHGDGPAVVCLHGVPASSYLYRKVLPELAGHGLRGLAFDLPGLGLAERPEDFDYTWSGLGRWAVAAVDALGLDRFHLVVHDIGGPVGFELAAALPDRIASLTVLNTMVEVADFRRPWSMEPFAHRGLGEAYLRLLSKPAFRVLMRRQGIADAAAVPDAELDAYVDLLKRGDGGRAFLRIMRGFETTAAKQQLYLGTLTGERYPVQAVWGARDPALTLADKGEAVRRAAGLEEVRTVPGKHFLQEDQAGPVARMVAELVQRA
ncbi:alpha/beta fold hydrolase [Nocardioides donggukensis]|uniref:Alpha/beta fold hydrolase n=1 Tax=Nocardioides donggukensis TaxID=2774019 RepID=A0A927K3W9_9ACTN|nr:alpha/beta fold hydrolase [Nocardioides donggukensis]MBD8870177.1 alpha/beta fold hydrolase [Nocardioides donggukensis]